MIRAAVISLVAAQVPAAAQACVIYPRTCDTAEGHATLLDHAGTVVLFDEILGDPAQQRRRVILAECNSRSGVMVEQDEAAIDIFWAAEGYLAEVMHDDRPQTLDEVARHLRGTGADAVRVTMGAGHCGCDLPSQPEPDNYCPDL